MLQRLPIDCRPGREHGSLALVAALLLASACVGVRALEPGDPVRLSAGEALAFGRVRVLEGGRELTPWNADLLEELALPGEPEVRLSLFRVESAERSLYARIEADGWFTWALPPGTWLVYRSFEGPPAGHDVLAAFQVLPGGEAQWLGELELRVAVERDSHLEAQAYAVEGVSVRSDLDEARAAFARRHPADARELLARPFVAAPELRGLFDDWQRSRAEELLARLGLRLLPE